STESNLTPTGLASDGEVEDYAVTTSFDNPPVAVNDSNTASEDGVLTATGNVLTNDSDPDTADTISVGTVNGSGANVGATVTGTYGSLVVNPNGTYTYTLDNASAAVQSIAQGQTVNDVFQYQAQDNHGVNSAPATLTIAVSGSNDPPVANPD